MIWHSFTVYRVLQLHIVCRKFTGITYRVSSINTSMCCFKMNDYPPEEAESCLQLALQRLLIPFRFCTRRNNSYMQVDILSRPLEMHCNTELGFNENSKMFSVLNYVSGFEWEVKLSVTATSRTRKNKNVTSLSQIHSYLQYPRNQSAHIRRPLGTNS